jgi:hypothetical protein
MKKIQLYLINPLDFFRGYVGFPLGYYKFEGCNLNNGKPCYSCKEAGGDKGGWGIQFIFFGFSVSNPS